MLKIGSAHPQDASNGNETQRPGSRVDTSLVDRIRVPTPEDVARALADEVHARRRPVGSVLDLGAGDGRLGRYISSQSYRGIENDSKFPARRGPEGRIDKGCALTIRLKYDVVVSNPPYVRHQDLDNKWKQLAARSVSRSLGVSPDGRSNAYLYFLWWAIARTRSDGLVAFIIPAEWQFQPSAATLRQFLDEQGWSRHVVRLPDSTFSNVRTTATITIIDKREQCSKQNRLRRRTARYANAGPIHASRGLSSGSKKTFVLTEAERRNAAIGLGEVVPCVTSFRGIHQFSRLTRAEFESRFVRAGLRCWLLKTENQVSARMKRWLEKAPVSVRANATCRDRKPWYSFRIPKPPALLYSSAFLTNPPFFVENTIGAIAVGSVHGIHGARTRAQIHRLQKWLGGRDWMRLVQARDGGLRRIAVGQVNHLLRSFEKTSS